MYDCKYKTDRRIDEIIDDTIKRVLSEIGIKHKASMYEYESIQVNAIPIIEVRDRLRKLIENKTFDREIDNKLIVKEHGSRCVIYFHNEQHPDIYSVEEGEKSKEQANEIRTDLKRTFAEINSSEEIQNCIIKKKDFADASETYRKKLDLTFRQILSKTNLNIVSQCDYLKPGLE